MNDQSIAEICGFINNKTIGNWRARSDIPTKEIGDYIKNGYRFLHMPKEYKQYVYLIDDETVEGLTNTLRAILSKTREELHQKGMIAKDFVLHNKNKIIQAKKILDIINKEQ